MAARTAGLDDQVSLLSDNFERPALRWYLCDAAAALIPRNVSKRGILSRIRT